MAPDLYRRLMMNGWMLAGILGAIWYLIVVGPMPLDVTNIDWILRRHDIATAQTGWMFYRLAPWAAPIAFNPTYGMDFAGSILFSDAVPLFAIPFKALSPILPETFQYFGLWTLVSFVLQGVCGWLLMSRVSDNPVVRLLGAILILLTPLYMFRLVAWEHMSLTAHWPVLAALALCLPPHTRRPWLWWGLLVVSTAFVHAYIFAMVATLWLADLARRFLVDFRKRDTWLEPIGIGAMLAALVTVTGVWAGPAGEFQGGFGWFKMNVLSPFDPNPFTGTMQDRPGWSYIVPDLPNWAGDYEGFAYAGLGAFVLAAMAGWAAPHFFRTQRLSWVYAPLGLALFGMGVFAVSQNVTIGSVNLWLGWPGPLQSLGELFRATGRFIWPFYYFIFFACVYVLAKKLSPRLLIAALAGVILIQAVDTSRGWISDGRYLRERDTFQSPLTSPFWDEAAARYRSVRLAPYWVDYPRSLHVARFALAHGLPTDAAYLSRTSTPAKAASEARIAHGIATGEWPTDTLFVVDEDVAQRAAATLDRSRNFLARVDGVIVLAPGWAGCSNCGATAFQ
jgi:hypothetical protein